MFRSWSDRTFFYAMLLAIFIFTNPGKLNLDDYHRLITAVMMVRHASFNIDPSYLPETGYVYHIESGGELYVNWGLFSSLPYVPIVVLGEIARTIFPWLSQLEVEWGKQLLVERLLSSILVAPVIMLFNAILCERIIRREFDCSSQKSLYNIIALLFLNSQLLFYSSAYEECFMMLLYLSAFVVHREIPIGMRKGIYLGFLMGFVLNVRFYVGMPIFSLFLLWELYCGKIVRARMTDFLSGFVLALIPFIAIFVGYNYVRFETVAPTGFFETMVQYGFSSPSLFRQNFGAVFDYLERVIWGSQSIFLYSPLLLIMPFCIRDWLRRTVSKESSQQALLFYSFSVCAVYIGVHALISWGSLDWAAWGPRYITPVVVFLFLLTVPLLIEMQSIRGIKSYLYRVLIALSAVVQILAILGWEHTEALQGHRTLHIIQRAENIMEVTLRGNPLAPYLANPQPLFAAKEVEEYTNQDGELRLVKFKPSAIYEGYALWPVVIGFALNWTPWKVGILIFSNALLVFVLWFCWRQKLRRL